MFTETISPGNDSHCSQKPSDDSRQPNTGTQIGLVTRSSLNTNAGINKQVRSLNTQQRKVIDVFCEWARKKVICLNSNNLKTPNLCISLLLLEPVLANST